MVIEDKNDHSETLNLLKEGNLTLKGRLIEASNASLYGTIEFGDQYLNVIYKPIAGERPLWDFSEGNLASREVATYLVSEALNLKCVPPTLLRDGQFGEGSVQLWIDDCEETGDRYLERSQGLRKIAFLDAVVNNTDRKIGHLLFKKDQIFGCDHGVTFHQDYKLRTVLWQFADEPLSEEELKSLKNFNCELSDLITETEIEALHNRVANLLQEGKFPLPPTDWPAIPWPPY
jgi:hypothetical protein